MGVGDVVALVAGVIENFESNLADDDDERLNLSLGFLWYDFDFSTTRTTIVCDDLFFLLHFHLFSLLRIMRVTLGLLLPLCCSPVLVPQEHHFYPLHHLPFANCCYLALYLSMSPNASVCIVITPSTRNLCTHLINIHNPPICQQSLCVHNIYQR